MTRDDCPNPFCDGYGWVDVSPSINGRAWVPGCQVGPHPRPPDDWTPSKRLPVPPHMGPS